MAAGSLRIGSFLDTGVIFCLMASISRLRRRSRCECNPPQPFGETVCRRLAHISYLKPCSFICRVQNRGENKAEPQSAGLLILLRQKQRTTVASWPSRGDEGGGQGEGGAGGGQGGGAGLGYDCKPRLLSLERLACFAAAAVSPPAHSRFDRLSW